MDDQNGWDTAAGTPAFAADGNVDPDLDVLVHRIERDALEALSPRRYEHSRGCAAFAAAACARAGLDPRKGLAAGWAHDLARSLPQGRQEALALACPVPLPASVFRDPVLMHGPAAATLLARRHGVRDWDILEAVALHTVGRPDMGPLAKIVWAADKMEEGRGHVDGAERARCLGLAPDDLLLQALAATISWLRTRGREVAPETLDLYNSLRRGRS